MAGKDFGQGFQSFIKGAANTVQGAVDSVKNAAKDVRLPDIKPEQLGTIFGKKPDQADPPAGMDYLSAWSALKIIYYMMSADGEIRDSEVEKFDSVCKALAPNNTIDRRRLIEECQAQLAKVIDPEDYYEILQEGVQEALHDGLNVSHADIAPRLLVWDLLTIAYSDGEYAEAERKLLKYVVRKLDIDKTVYLELKSSLLSLNDLETEINWIKSTDRPYLTIEAMVKELENRKNVIFDSVKDLIHL